MRPLSPVLGAWHGDRQAEGEGRAAIRLARRVGTGADPRPRRRLVLLAGALALVAISGAVTGKGRVQRAADLAAISAARSMRDDLPRLLSPPTLPGGVPNPVHIDKLVYLARARAAAIDAARANGFDRGGSGSAFPTCSPSRRCGRRPSSSPTCELDGGAPVEASAVAEAAAPASARGGMPSMAGGGGYSGPLVYRNGEGMRPDVAAAFDRMAAAARGRRDLAPGRLRLPLRRRTGGAVRRPSRPHVGRAAGSLPAPLRDRARPRPETAYGWLAANADPFRLRSALLAGRPGTTASTPGRSPARRRATPRPGRGGATAPFGGATLPTSSRPSSAPDPPAAAHWNVSAALLAGQLMAESGFDPIAGSPAGAQGIAQFIPARRLLRPRQPLRPRRRDRRRGPPDVGPDPQFGSPELALAAYNAGPAPVEACHCIPAYPETQAYVTRILALLGGAGALAVPSFEVRWWRDGSGARERGGVDPRPESALATLTTPGRGQYRERR